MKSDSKNVGTPAGRSGKARSYLLGRWLIRSGTPQAVKWGLAVAMTLGWISLCFLSVAMVGWGLLAYGGLFGLVALFFLLLVLLPFIDGVARTGRSRAPEHVVYHPWRRGEPKP
ncbi:MAG: hypothetical protein OEU26_03170 [Candidatus Tectomicrobia bacterium]|nr:hypothetical protein [Candidatus Tectomicrobia bacterium]